MIGLALVGMAAMWLRDKGWLQQAAWWAWRMLAAGYGTLMGGM